MMLVVTSELGFLVGKGPSVSLEVVVQVPVPLPVDVPVLVEVVGSTSADEHELNAGATVAMPSTEKVRFKNSLRSIGLIMNESMPTLRSNVRWCCTGFRNRGKQLIFCGKREKHCDWQDHLGGAHGIILG